MIPLEKKKVLPDSVEACPLVKIYFMLVNIVICDTNTNDKVVLHRHEKNVSDLTFPLLRLLAKSPVVFFIQFTIPSIV